MIEQTSNGAHLSHHDDGDAICIEGISTDRISWILHAKSDVGGKNKAGALPIVALSGQAVDRRQPSEVVYHETQPALEPLAATESPWEIIKRLYEREISAGIVSDLERGLMVWIEHQSLTQAMFAPDEFDNVAEWTLSEEQRLLPRE